MEELKEFNLEKGLEKILKLLEKIKEKPRLIGVYGYSNSGKTFFIDKVREQIDSCTTRKMGSIQNLQNPQRKFKYAKYFECFALHLLPLESLKADEITKRYVGKEIDVNVLIYNPKFSSDPFDFLPRTFMKPALIEKKKEILKKFNLIISNNSSYHKNP